MTCAVSEEGDNLALYLTPVSLGTLARSVRLGPDELALVLEDVARGEEARLCRWQDLEALDLEADLVHLPAGTRGDDLALDALPAPLLACVEQALPTELGSRVALSVQDGCHGVVIAREPSLLAECLSAHLDDYLSAVLGQDAPPGTFDPLLLSELLEPRPPGACYELKLTERRRYWILDAEQRGGGSGPDLRWVCEAGGGRWRAWSWQPADPERHVL